MRSALLLGLAVLAAACAGTEVSNIPARVTVSPTTVSLHGGETVQLSATVTNDNGETVPAEVAWHSSDAARVSVDGDGLVKVLIEPAETEPPVEITATAGPVSGQTEIELVWRPPLSVWPDTNVLFVGMSRRLQARAIIHDPWYPSPEVDSYLPNDWLSTDSQVASVDAGGTVSANAVGHVRITARLADGRSAVAELYVQAPPPSLRFVDVAGSNTTSPKLSAFMPNPIGHGCGLTDTGDVYCWGYAIDAGGPTDRCELVRRSGAASYGLFRFRCSEIPYRLASPVKFTSIAARGELGCGVATTRKVYCWGPSGVVSQIASNDDFVSVHVPEVDTNFVLAPGYPSCGLRIDRTLVCWGGPVGSTPTQVGTMTWRTIADGGRCGIADDGGAYCFTSGASQRIGTASGWAAIAVGFSSTCLLDSAGQMSCGGAPAEPVPASGVPMLARLGTYVGGPSYDSLVCGLDATGDLYCNGGNKAIDLGGTKLKRFFGNCGMGVDDKAYCWTADPATGTVAFRRIPGQ